LVLPAVVSWIDAPNVLLLWSVGCLVVLAFRWLNAPVWLLVAVGLTLSANGLALRPAGAFDVAAVWALMALGAALPRSAFAVGAALPSWLGLLGRHPVSWYVGHVLALTGAAMLLGAS
jgi:hypothetical protein